MGGKIKLDGGKKSKTKWLLKSKAIDTAGKILGSRIEMLSNREATIDGCFGVLEYTDTYLKIKLSKGSLILMGEGFDITLFEDKSITVVGQIASIEFCV